MAAFFTRLLAVILAICGAVSKAKREKEQRDAQHEVDDATANPTAWFDGHFNGVRDGSAVPPDAGNADKASAEKPETER